MIGLGTLVILLAVLYVVYLLIMHRTQARMVFTGSFIGPRLLRKECSRSGQWIKLGQHKVDALFLEEEGAEALIIAHGNAQTLEDWAYIAEYLHSEMGLQVLVIEYPRFQESPDHAQPEPNQETVAEGFVAGYDWLRERGVERVHAMGLSIGTGVVCDLSERRELASLCLLAPFHSIARLSFGYLVPPFVLKSPYRNVAALAKYQGPVTILQAMEDQLFKTPHITALLQAKPEAGHIEVPCGHNAMPDYLPNYESELKQLWSVA